MSLFLEFLLHSLKESIQQWNICKLPLVWPLGRFAPAFLSPRLLSAWRTSKWLSFTQPPLLLPLRELCVLSDLSRSSTLRNNRRRNMKRSLKPRAAGKLRSSWYLVPWLRPRLFFASTLSLIPVSFCHVVVYTIEQLSFLFSLTSFLLITNTPFFISNSI